MTTGAPGRRTMTRVPTEAPVVVTVLSGRQVLARCTLAWRNEIERSVLVTAVAVVALHLGADAVEARRAGSPSRPAVPAGPDGKAGADEVAVVNGSGVEGASFLAGLLAPLGPLLPPNAGFRPLAAEVAAAWCNLAGC